MPNPLFVRARQFLRAALGRCPLCGTPWRRVGWVGLASQCGVCQVHLERHENDSFLGAYTLNLFGTGWAGDTLTELAAVAAGLAACAASYAALSWALRIEEFRTMLGLFGRRFGR